MNRGDFKQHKFTYIMDDVTIKSCGVVCWKDSDTVYCLSSNCSNNGVESCYRKIQHGSIKIVRPKVIGLYKKYMGGIDLADMRR